MTHFDIFFFLFLDDCKGGFRLSGNFSFHVFYEVKSDSPQFIGIVTDVIPHIASIFSEGTDSGDLFRAAGTPV